MILAFAFAWWRLRADGLGLRPDGADRVGAGAGGGRTPGLRAWLPTPPRERTDLLLLVWWTLAVPLTFILGGGNHAWYLLPMYLPGAVLLGHLIAGIADGTFGDRLDDATAGTRFVDAGGPLASLRDRLPSTSGVRTAVTERWGPAAGAAVYPATCLLLAVLLLASYGAPLHEPYNDEQRELGTTIAKEVPEDATVHVWLGENTTTQSIMSVDFYADRPLERSNRPEIEGDPSIHYAVVPYGNASAIDRPHRVLAESPLNGISVVAFED